MKYNILKKENFIGIEIELSPRSFLHQPVVKWNSFQAYELLKTKINKNIKLKNIFNDVQINNASSSSPLKAIWWFEVEPEPAKPEVTRPAPTKKRTRNTSNKKKAPMRKRMQSLSKKVSELRNESTED
tara:strand:+ start:784 stop:1167 length:384 start_codon:yes stop_codon:yes gene_type:complete